MKEDDENMPLDPDAHDDHAPAGGALANDAPADEAPADDDK